MDFDYDGAGDDFFSVGKLYVPLWGERSTAQWNATLNPALPPPQPVEHVEHRMRELRLRWQRRLSQLRDLEWPPLQDGSLRFQYARNCPPFACQPIRQAIPCKFRFCPFCWAREVVGPLYDALVAVRPTRFVYTFDETIVELVTKGFYVGSVWYDGDLSEVVAQYRALGLLGPFHGPPVKRRRGDPDALGGWLQLSLTMGERKATLRRRGVMLSDVELTPPFVPRTPREWRRWRVPDGHGRKRRVAQLVSRVASYHGWWLRGDPSWVIHVVDALPRTRLVNYYGILRGVPRGIPKDQA